MTKFNRDNFHYHGGYLTYGYVGMRDGVFVREDEFVARFKYGGGAGTFKTFLIRNFTVEEYFAKRAAGYSPLTILEAKGYVSSNVRKGMKARGYSVFNTASYREYFERFVSSSGDCAAFWAKLDEEFAAINSVAA